MDILQRFLVLENPLLDLAYSPNIQTNGIVTQDKGVNSENKSETSANMAFPIYREQLDELKRHVFGWNQYQMYKSQNHLQPAAPFKNLTPSAFMPNAPGALNGSFSGQPQGFPISGFVNQTPKVNSAVSITTVPYWPAAETSQFISPYSGFLTVPSVNSSSGTPTGGGATLHDDIMKQSQLVLNVVQESSDIKEEKKPSSVFHWQDVRNSIAHELLNESQQKIEGGFVPVEAKAQPVSPQAPVPDTQAHSDQSTDQRLANLLKAVDKHLKEQSDSSEPSPSNKDTPKISSNVSKLLKAIEQEIGTPIKIVLDNKDDKQGTLHVRNANKTKASVDCVTTTAEMTALNSISDDSILSSEELAERKKKYREDYEKVNSQYEELRKKRLSLLVQAYTGKSDPRPLTTRGNNSFKEVSSNMSLGPTISATDVPVLQNDGNERKTKLASSFEPRVPIFPDKHPEATSLVQTYLPIENDSQKLNLNRSLPLEPAGSKVSTDPMNRTFSHMSPAAQQKEDTISDSLNRTISAISKDSQLIKERIKSMREQLTKAETSRSVNPEGEPYPEELGGDSFIEDEFEGEDEPSPYRSPTKSYKKNPNNSRIASHRVNRTSLLRAPIREIYPHKKGYESPGSYYSRRQDQQDQEESEDTSLLEQATYDSEQMMTMDDLASDYDLGFKGISLHPRQYRRHTATSSQERLRLAEQVQRHQRQSKDNVQNHSEVPYQHDQEPVREGIQESLRDDLGFKAVRKYTASLRSKNQSMRRKGDPELPPAAHPEQLVNSSATSVSSNSSTYQCNPYQETPSDHMSLDRQTGSSANDFKMKTTGTLSEEELNKYYNKAMEEIRQIYSEKDRGDRGVLDRIGRERNALPHDSYSFRQRNSSSFVENASKTNSLANKIPPENSVLMLNRNSHSPQERARTNDSALAAEEQDATGSHSRSSVGEKEMMHDQWPVRDRQHTKERQGTSSNRYMDRSFEFKSVRTYIEGSPFDASLSRNQDQRQRVENNSVSDISHHDRLPLKEEDPEQDIGNLHHEKSNHQKKTSDLSENYSSHVLSHPRLNTDRNSNVSLLSSAGNSQMHHGQFSEVRDPNPPLQDSYSYGRKLNENSLPNCTKDTLQSNLQNLEENEKRLDQGKQKDSKDPDTGSETTTSDTEFVVLKDGDILKRPRSTSPNPAHKMHRQAAGYGSPMGSPGMISVTKETQEASSSYSRVMDDSTSPYCQAVRDNVSPKQKQHLTEQDKLPTKENCSWSEPKRYFGPRESKTKEVQFLSEGSPNLPGTTSAGDISSSRSYPASILKSSDSHDYLSLYN